ncbi:hypothetical protein V5O48_000118 [Marasmius crinis-equi]|uniref:Uncharacterized protein n=1 Tax=Marasmius crinis-equi TaxID=585013 RepID=A0ABR3G2B2_9AGAR
MPGLLAYFSASAQPQSGPVLAVDGDDDAKKEAAATQVSSTTSSEQPPPADIPLPQSPIVESAQTEDTKPAPSKPTRRLSLPTFNRGPASHKLQKDAHKTILTGKEEHQKEANAVTALSKRIAFSRRSNSEKKAKETALIVRTLIVGPSASTPSVTTAIAKPRMSKLKSDLSKPSRANKVIAQLRSLPAEDDTSNEEATLPKHSAPIHAVCLEHSDSTEHDLHFSQLSDSESVPQATPLDKLSSLFSEMRIVSFFKAPDLGIGQAGDGDGPLAGALPTAETVINGIEQITPQLMALSYATGKAILPDHTGVYPPTDRVSVITYWWGLEILLPPPSLQYLSTARSISNTAVNFLSALALVNGGVREILPFVRYMSQFIEFEFNNIKVQDKGDGVVCAATWIMPAALVPRPWDFPTPPPAPATVPSIPEETEPSGDKGEALQPPAREPVAPSEPPKAALPAQPSTPLEPGNDDRAIPVMPSIPIAIPAN